MTSSSASAWLPTARPQRRRSRRPAAASSKAPQGGRGGRKREREGGGGGGGRPADRLPAGRTRQPQPDEGETHAAAHVTTEPARLICRAADARIAAASVRRERLAAVRSPATGTAARGHYTRAPRSTQNLMTDALHRSTQISCFWTPKFSYADRASRAAPCQPMIIQAQLRS